MLDLLDSKAFLALFPDGPPAFTRLTPSTLTVAAGGGWDVVRGAADAGAGADEAVSATFSRADLLANSAAVGETPWPGLPLLRPAATAAGGGELFVWAWLVAAETARQAAAAGGSDEVAPRLSAGERRVLSASELAALELPQVWALLNDLNSRDRT